MEQARSRRHAELSVFVLPCLSTVENIAIHIATVIAQEESGKVFVRAFEDAGKGALGQAGED